MPGTSFPIKLGGFPTQTGVALKGRDEKEREDKAVQYTLAMLRVFKNKQRCGPSLPVQWLRLCAPNAEGAVSIPGWATKFLHVKEPKNFFFWSKKYLLLSRRESSIAYI